MKVKTKHEKEKILVTGELSLTVKLGLPRNRDIYLFIFALAIIDFALMMKGHQKAIFS